jgi:hypothetical protein
MGYEGPTGSRENKRLQLTTFEDQSSYFQRTPRFLNDIKHEPAESFCSDQQGLASDSG